MVGFRITKNICRSYNAPSGIIDIKWYENKGSNYVQVGSGNTLTITEKGYLKVIALTEDGEVAIDELALMVDPAIPNLYNKFIVSSALEDEFTITAFTVPDPAVLTENEINSIYGAERNGLKLIFKNTTASNLGRNEYAFDFVNNKAYISNQYTIRENEILEFYKKK